jgi:hypothetical protein
MPKILIKRGTAAQWTASTTALLAGELGLDTSNNILKVGNGTSLWNSLSGLTLTSTQVNELAQDAISTAFSNGTHTNITVTYNDNANSISLSTGPDVVTTTSLNNTLTNPTTGYVPISDVGNVDGVAPLDSNGLIADQYIPATIARDSELFSGSYNDLTNKPDLTIYAPKSSPTFTGTVTSSNNLVVDGNLTVNGTTFNASSTTIVIEDNLVQLAHQNPANTVDLGVVVAYNDGSAKHAGIVRDVSADKWKLFKGVTTEPATTVDFTQGSLDDLEVAGLTATSATFTGTVSGVTKSMVGLGNVDNTSDANKPVSTATQTALDLKLSLTDPSIDYYITNSGSGSYTVNGVANGPIEFVKGKKYRIHINASGHPFWIQTVSGAYSSGNVYSTGITGNGTQVGHIIVELPQNAPDNLYYACQFHSSMAGAVLVRTDNVVFNPQSSGYTVTTSDSGRLIEMSGGGFLTIADSTAFPIGFTCDVLQTGSSQVTIQGSGFTPNATPGLKLRQQWSSATLVKRALNSWVVMGDLSV